jgi:hypothetical protein
MIPLGEDNVGYKVHRCPLSPAVKLGPTTIERVAETADGTDLARPFVPAIDEHQSVVATLTEEDGTNSRRNLASDEIDDERVDTFAPFLPEPTPVGGKPHFLDLITFEGDEALQRDLRALCREFEHLFTDKLGENPAFIPEFDIKVNTAEWETNKNRTPIRPQTTHKETLISTHVNTMRDSGVIEPSRALFYSHPVVVTKPDGSTRFCIDYRNLNDCSEARRWPLPNITATFARIGSKNPDTFGVMDLTSGYHQAPLSVAARAFTAFICFSGVYQFTRVPFGPKGAPSYFQEMMATVVLFGLIYLICERYLDDCIVYATGNEEFLNRLRAVFQAFSKHNIFLKAKKCKFGMKKIEYVGKEISKDGITMSETKINTVLTFPRPGTNTQLRSFLGLANYFRDFVPNHSHVVHPLHNMVDTSATKRTPITWTPEGDTAFTKIR